MRPMMSNNLGKEKKIHLTRRPCIDWQCTVADDLGGKRSLNKL